MNVSRIHGHDRATPGTPPLAAAPDVVDPLFDQADHIFVVGVRLERVPNVMRQHGLDADLIFGTMDRDAGLEGCAGVHGCVSHRAIFAIPEAPGSMHQWPRLERDQIDIEKTLAARDLLVHLRRMVGPADNIEATGRETRRFTMNRNALDAHDKHRSRQPGRR